MSSSSKQQSSQDAASETSIVGTSPPRRGRRVLIRIAMILTIVAGATFGLHLWQERAVGQASAALEQGDAKYAHFLLERFLKKHPDHPRAMALQARTFVALGVPDEAIALFDRAGAADVDDLHAWARALMMKGQWSHALPLLNRVLDFDSHDADALYEVTACRVRLGKFTEALVSAKQLAEDPEQAARGYVFLATIQSDLGNQAEAAKAFAAVLKREPEAENLQVAPAEFYLQYGRIFLRLGKPAEAITQLKTSVALGETAEAFVLLGTAALQLGEPKKASQAWERALQLQPLSREAREGLANIALQNGQGDEALKWLEPLAGLPGLPASTTYLFQRAHTLLKNEDEIKKWQEITEKQRHLEELNSDIASLLVDSPDSFWARVIRTHRFAERGNWSEAELLLKRLLKEAPAEPFVIELADAVFRRAELPSIEKLPIEHF